jgi:predicted dehydrogenase
MAVQMKDGSKYAPKGKAKPVVKPGEFIFAAIALDHGHIYGMCNGLIEAGATLKSVYDPDEQKVKEFCDQFPGVIAAKSEQEILDDPTVQLVAGAAIPYLRCALGLRVMAAGKDYFTDKAPLTTLEQLQLARKKVAATGRKYMVYYSERLHVESAVFAGDLIDQGAIGKVLQVTGFGPHRLGIATRPEWFFEKEKYGGILCDIGSHQLEQLLFYTKSTDAVIEKSRVANYNHPATPGLEDYGDMMLTTNTGAAGYFKLDWFTPDGLSTWGDGRSFILGTEGFIEQRKYVDLATDHGPNQVYLVNQAGEQHFDVTGKVGFPFFGAFILDCLNRTEHAMTQAHAFKAAELAIVAENTATTIST